MKAHTQVSLEKGKWHQLYAALLEKRKRRRDEEGGKREEQGDGMVKAEGRMEMGSSGIRERSLNYLTPLGRSEDKQLSAIVTSGKLVAS